MIKELIKINQDFKSDYLKNKLYDRLSSFISDVYKISDNNSNIPQLIKVLNDRLNEEENTSSIEYIKIIDTSSPIGLNEILIRYFGSGFTHSTDWTCESYGDMIDVIYSLSDLSDIDLNQLVDSLDEISIKNCIYDDYGDVIHTEDMSEEEYDLFMNKRRIIYDIKESLPEQYISVIKEDEIESCLDFISEQYKLPLDKAAQFIEQNATYFTYDELLQRFSEEVQNSSISELIVKNNIYKLSFKSYVSFD